MALWILPIEKRTIRLPKAESVVFVASHVIRGNGVAVMNESLRTGELTNGTTKESTRSLRPGSRRLNVLMSYYTSEGMVLRSSSTHRTSLAARSETIAISMASLKFPEKHS